MIFTDFIKNNEMNRILILLCLSLLVSCGEPNQKTQSNETKKTDQVTLKASLDQLEEELKNSTSNEIDKVKANALVEKSIQYVDAFPKDEWSPGYLFRAAEVCVGLKAYDKALGYWERMRTDYSTHEKAPVALFLQGFTCDNQMTRKVEEAKKYYNEFLLTYPDHEFADQVKELLKNIDISPEELIKSFQKKRASGE